MCICQSIGLFSKNSGHLQSHNPCEANWLLIRCGWRVSTNWWWIRWAKIWMARMFQPTWWLCSSKGSLQRPQDCCMSSHRTTLCHQPTIAGLFLGRRKTTQFPLSCEIISFRGFEWVLVTKEIILSNVTQPAVSILEDLSATIWFLYALNVHVMTKTK